MNKRESLELKVSTVLSMVAGIFLIIASVLMFVNMITRTVADINIRFVYEVAQLCSVGVASFAIPYATLKKAHTEMDMITSHMGQTVRALFAIIANLVEIATMVFTTYALYYYAYDRTLVREVTTATHLPIWIFRWVFAVGITVTTIFVIIELIDNIKHLKNKDYPTAAAATLEESTPAEGGEE